VTISIQAAVLAVFLLRSATPAPAAAPPAPPSCREIQGLGPHLEPGRVLFLGEIHGASEPPAFMRDVACAAVARGLEVTVELEIPITENVRIQSFMASSGAPPDVQALIAGEFWRKEYQDGRPSRARLDLIEALRRLRAGGGQVQIVPIDPGLPNAAERDRGMADFLGTAVDASPLGFHVALLGNLHTSLDIGTPWDPKVENAAYLFARARPGVKVVALDIARTGGTAWTCTDGVADHCGARDVKGDPAAGTWNVVMNTGGRRRGHDGVYGVGSLTASPPARDAND